MHKILLIGLLYTISFQGQIHADEEIFLKLADLKLCNLNTAREPSNKIVSKINDLRDLYNNQSNEKSTFFKKEFDQFILSKNFFTCYEKINLINLYAAYQFKIQKFKNSLLLYERLKKFKGIDEEFISILEKKIAQNNMKLNQVNVSSFKENNLNVKQTNKIEELENKLFDQANKIAELQGLLKVEKDRTFKIEKRNASLRAKLENFDASPGNKMTDRATSIQDSLFKKELETAYADLEKTYERLYILEKELIEKNQKLISFQGKLTSIQDKLDSYESQKTNDYFETENFNSNNQIWFWIILTVAIIAALYFYNENINREPDSELEKNDDFSRALENLLYQIEPNEDLNDLIDVFVFNYILGFSEGFKNNDLESKLLSQELVSALSSESYFVINNNYIIDDSELAIEGRMKGKQDGQRLRNNSVPIILKNYLKKDIESE